MIGRCNAKRETRSEDVDEAQVTRGQDCMLRVPKAAGSGHNANKNCPAIAISNIHCPASSRVAASHQKESLSPRAGVHILMT